MQAPQSPTDNFSAPANEAAPWDRVDFSSQPAWAEATDGYDATFRGKDGDHVTQLLWSWQVDAESGKTFFSTARRLETAMAVQHESQWSLDLDARASRLTLHWLRVVRGGVQIDQLKRERMRLLQRETQLEHHVIDGSWTLLLVLEDVRPGDVIEAGYTTEWHHPIRPGGCEVFFVVPSRIAVQRYRLSVLSEASRGDLRWKTSDDAPTLREETAPDGKRRWVWEGSQPKPREDEPNQPSTFLDCTWVQVSDLANWSDLAARVDAAWSKSGETADTDLIAAFAKPATVDAAAIVGLVRHIQDSFRYLSINLETGGWIPASPRKIARQRHGDCKDLAWLAATVLRGWGVKARPVLVGTALRDRVAMFLPMAIAFNHAILEVEWDGAARWFDLTAREQGGTFATQPVSWFGQGLVVDATDGGLREQPGARVGGVYSVKETVLLDTNKNASCMVEIRTRAEGAQAESLRRDRAARGAEAFARDREEWARNRHGRARRLGELQWRDDRVRNICDIAEAFELTGAVYPGEQGQKATYDSPPSLLAQGFLLPSEAARRGPWDMPFPVEVAHEIVVKSPGLIAGTSPRRRWSTSEFEAIVEGSLVRGQWTRRVRFRVEAPEISADRVLLYRRDLESLFREFAWRIYLPWGHARPRRGAGFGELNAEEDASPVGGSSLIGPRKSPAAVAPAVQTTATAQPTSQTAAQPSTKPVVPKPPAEVKLESGGKRRRRTFQDKRLDQEPKNPLPGVSYPMLIVAVVVVAVILIVLARGIAK